MNPAHSDLDKQIKEHLRIQGEGMPVTVRTRIDQTLANLPGKSDRRRGRNRARSIIASCLVGCIVLTASAFVMKDSTFAESVKPYIHSVFSWMGDKGLSRGLETEAPEELPVLAEKTSSGYTLRIHEARFDGLRLSFSYSLAKQDGSMPKQTFITPAFQLDPAIKKEAPGALMSDSGSLWGEDKVGIVNYFFDSPLPDQFPLNINVPKLAISTPEADGQTTLAGDWSFAIDIRKSGTVATRSYGKEYIRTLDNIQFGVVKSRLSFIASEWNFHWEIPGAIMKKYGPSLDSPARYGMKYKITVSGSDLDVITSISSSRSRTKDRSLPEDQWEHQENIRLFTDPLPEGARSVKIVPILMVFPQPDTDETYREQPLDSFAVEIPVP